MKEKVTAINQPDRERAGGKERQLYVHKKIQLSNERSG